MCRTILPCYAWNIRDLPPHLFLTSHFLFPSSCRLKNGAAGKVGKTEGQIPISFLDECRICDTLILLAFIFQILFICLVSGLIGECRESSSQRFGQEKLFWIAKAEIRVWWRLTCLGQKGVSWFVAHLFLLHFLVSFYTWN